jgi:hypothetical protein
MSETDDRFTVQQASLPGKELRVTSAAGRPLVAVTDGHVVLADTMTLDEAREVIVNLALGSASAHSSASLATAREPLAAYAHRAWAGWMRYLFEKSAPQSDGCVLIPPQLVARWRRQVETAYDDLPDPERESDRKEADEMLGICRAALVGQPPA